MLVIPCTPNYYCKTFSLTLYTYVFDLLRHVVPSLFHVVFTILFTDSYHLARTKLHFPIFILSMMIVAGLFGPIRTIYSSPAINPCSHSLVSKRFLSSRPLFLSVHVSSSCYVAWSYFAGIFS